MEKQGKKVQLFYDDLIYGGKASLSESEAMLKAFPFPTIEQLPSLKVLEVGLGRGEWSVGLATHAQKYTGLDYSGRTIDYVYRELKSRALTDNHLLCQGTVLSLPFEDDSYDAVYCIGVIHATPDVQQGFRELYRVLRPGGSINLMLYGRVQPRNVIRDALFNLSRLGPWAEDLILKWAMKMESWHLPDSVLYNASGQVWMYKDWYLAPIQSHHTIKQISQWAQEEGGEVTYVFLDPYRNSLKRHQRWALNKVLGWFLCPDFMVSIKKPGTLQ